MIEEVLPLALFDVVIAQCFEEVGIVVRIALRVVVLTGHLPLLSLTSRLPVPVYFGPVALEDVVVAVGLEQVRITIGTSCKGGCPAYG